MDKRIDLGFMDVPKGYEKLSIERKEDVCDILIEKLLIMLDKQLPAYVNRFDFVKDVLESSLLSNEEEENYEVCQVIRDTIKRLDEV